MEKFNGANGLRAKYQLQYEFGSIKKAAIFLGISYTNLSRILNGKPHELKTHISILMATGDLPMNDYTYPFEDMATFKLLNAGLINTKKRGS